MVMVVVVVVVVVLGLVANGLAIFRLVILLSGLKINFAGHGLGLGKIYNQVHFQFSLCTFAVFCSVHMTFCQPVCIHTNKDLRYLLNIYCGINTWTCLFQFHLQCIDLFAAGIHTAIKHLDLNLTWTCLLLDLIQVWLPLYENKRDKSNIPINEQTGF